MATCEHARAGRPSTPYSDSWFIFHDHLSAWWEKEAQEYLRERGMFDRQVRAWGETNIEFSRYHESLVGDRPEMCALDTHLFADLEHALLTNVVATSSLPKGPPDDPGEHGRYDNGTPKELSSAMRRTWEYCPTTASVLSRTSHACR